MGKPLIVTKCLIPGRRADLLRRPRLVDFLHEHVDRKLVLVCAPAGYGKTSLLIEFARDVDLPVCWYSLDKSDRDLRIFVEYLLAAIRQRFPAFGRQALDVLASAEPLGDGEALVGVLVNEIYEEIPDFFVLVLDDYHQVDDSEQVNYFLDSFLQRLPENCHLIIASRTIPTLTPRGLALMTAQQQVVGLGARELRFTPQEIQELLYQNYSESMPDEVAQDLAHQSEGWITGILLSTQATWKDLLVGAARARGMGSSVYEYLANEVFALQSPEAQRFLLGSSILDEMSARRCDALLEIDNSAEMLAALEEGSVFIVRLEKGSERWHRYHALFQGFLRQKLGGDDPAWMATLHRRAAAILEESSEWDGAFHHRLAAGNVDGAVQVVLRAAQEMYEAGRLETLAEWIDQLPEEALGGAPRLIWYRGRVFGESGEWAKALHLYDRARRGFEARGDHEAVPPTLVDRSVSLRLLGRLPEAIESGQEALSRLKEEGRDAPLIAAGARRNVGICLCQAGELAEGTQQLRQALQLYRQADSPYGLAVTHGDLAVALALAGNLAASELHNEEALRLWQQLGHVANMANVLNSMAVDQHTRGESERALATLERALECAQRAGSRRLQAFILAGKGDLLREAEHWPQALEAYGESRRLAEALRDPSLRCYLLNATAEVNRGRGEYVQALPLARQAYEQALEQGLTQDAARYQMTLAAIYLEQGDALLALEYLREAERVFQHAQARKELALARLHMARVEEALGDQHAGFGAVQRMIEAVMEVGYDHFLLPEAGRALEVLQNAAQAGVGGSLLPDLVRRARQRISAARLQPPVPVSEPAKVRLRFLGLGESSAYVNDQLVSGTEWNRGRVKELLFYLLSFQSRRKEQIGQVLWPELSASRLRGAFHVTLYRLRRVLQVDDCVLYDSEEYFFNRRLDYWYDVEEFEALVGQAEQIAGTRPLEAAELLRRACDLYRGEFLAGASFPDEEWCFWRRDELSRRYLVALQRLGDLCAARGEYAPAQEAYRKILAADPLREDIHRAVMRCLALSGDRNGALRHYDTLVSLLREELGVQPLPETSRLQHTIAAGHPVQTA